jgi:DNA-binding NtrC family response regulator
MPVRSSTTPASGASAGSDSAPQPAGPPKLPVIGAIGSVVDAGVPDDMRIETVEWPAWSLSVLVRRNIDLVVPVVEAFDAVTAAFFDVLSRTNTHTPVLAVLPAADIHSPQFAGAASAADDFVVMPVRPEEWRERVGRLTGPRSPDGEVAAKLAAVMGLLQLVGRAPSFLDVVRKVPLIARSGSPALITGETGTGKELCARAIHFTSPRRNQPFIPVDCGAIPDNLFENELFGHVRGAFTDAHRDQRGLVGLAEGGTLFLDEIDSLSIPAQAKLLRFLQDRSYRPLGSDRFLRANVNVLAAMNCNPEALVRDRQLRADLFFRLNVVRLHLSPLRERLSDIPLLARHFVSCCAAEAGLGAKVLSPSVLPKLLAHDWPGNVRELGNVLQRAVVLAPERHILPEHVILSLDAAAPPSAAADNPSDSTVSFRKGRAQVIEAFERSYVARLIEKHAGNVTRAAREAQKDRRAFGRLLKKHGLRGGFVTE